MFGAVTDSGLTGKATFDTVFAQSDLLGRTVTSRDVWGTTITPTYESLTGRVVSSTTVYPDATSTTSSSTVDADGKPLTITVDGQVTTLHYNATTQLLESVDYANGVKLNTLTRNLAGESTGFTWDFVTGNDVSDAVVRSQSGRIVQNTLTDGTTAEVSKYTFDAAGRLTTAVIPRHTLTYGYAPTSTCGQNLRAGMNGNRTSFTDLKDAGTGTETSSSVQYCYDNLDRLTSTSPTNVSAGASPVSGSSLTTVPQVGPPAVPASLVYDAHGNTTVLADQTMTNDVNDNHLTTTTVATATSPATVISYLRDAGGTIIQRTETPAGGTAEVVRYTAGAVLNGKNVVIQRSISLPGGASCTTLFVAPRL